MKNTSTSVQSIKAENKNKRDFFISMWKQKMNITSSEPENPSSSSHKCVTSSSKSLNNNNHNNFVDDQMDSDYRNVITMKTSDREKNGEKMLFSAKFFFLFSEEF